MGAVADCLAVLGDPSVRRIVVEHPDRFCRFGSEDVQAVLAAQGRELVVVDTAEGMTTWCGK